MVNPEFPIRLAARTVQVMKSLFFVEEPLLAGARPHPTLMVLPTLCRWYFPPYSDTTHPTLMILLKVHPTLMVLPTLR